MKSATSRSVKQWSGAGFASPLMLAIIGAAYWSVEKVGPQEESLIESVLIASPFVIMIATFGFVRVRVSRAGVHVCLGVLHLPTFFHALDAIERAEVVRAKPLLQGWGYRFISGGTAVVLRGGRALQLTMRGGRRFVVTVRDAQGAANAINELIKREGEMSA